MKKSLALLMALMLLVVSIAGCSSGSGDGDAVEAVHLRMNMTTNENSTWFLGASKFKEIVEEQTGGRYIVDIYPSEQLSGGDQMKGIENIQNGTTDVDIHSTIVYTIVDPRFTVVNMPWMIPTYEEADAALSGPGGDAIFAIAEENGVHPLAFGESGYRQLTNSVRQIHAPADMDGIKFRVPGIKMYVDLFGVLGANPTTMNFAEVFTSLQQNTIDGQENPLDIIKSAKLEEVQEYLTLWNYSYDVLLMSVSNKLWDTLSDEDKAVFEAAATEAMSYQKEQNRAKDAENLAYLEENMEVYEMTADEIAVFKAAAKPVYEEYEEIIGLDLMEMFGYEK